MLTHTFRHLPGISASTERQLWSAGVHAWEDFPAEGLTLSPRKHARLFAGLEESRQHLTRGNAAYFAATLPSTEHWRLCSHFRSSIAYLDIETTGLGAHSQVTTIALYDGHRIRHYVQGENLEQFGRDIADYALLVTYNGKCFDLPFLSRALGLSFPQAHIDLRYLLRNLGYRGGLKSCEKQLGLHRGNLEDVDGFFAVLLWQEYCASGNPRALETLLAYNIQDVVNLEILLTVAYNLNLQQVPLAGMQPLQMPAPLSLPFAPDTEIIARLRRRLAAAPWQQY